MTRSLATRTASAVKLADALPIKSGELVLDKVWLSRHKIAVTDQTAPYYNKVLRLYKYDPKLFCLQLRIKDHNEQVHLSMAHVTTAQLKQMYDYAVAHDGGAFRD